MVHQGLIAGEHIVELEDNGGNHQHVNPAGPGEFVQLLLRGGAALRFLELLAVLLIGGIVEINQCQCKEQVQGRLEHGGQLLDQCQIHLEQEEYHCQRDCHSLTPFEFLSHYFDSPPQVYVDGV